nr:hypothetical protein BaRGS_007316 [Batillaria attramentaria]
MSRFTPSTVRRYKLPWTARWRRRTTPARCECPDIVLVSDVDLDLDILDRDLFLSDTSSEGDTLELETLYNDLTVSDTSSEEDEDERPGTVEQSSDDSSEDDSSDDSSSEDESSDDESLEERVRCTFCGLVMTRRLFNEHTSTSRADYVTSPAIARVPRCKLCGSRTPPSPLARPHDSKQGDYVEEMPLGPHFTKDAESGNLRKFVILKWETQGLDCSTACNEARKRWRVTMKRTATDNDAAECGSPKKRRREGKEESCRPEQTDIDCQVEEDDDTSTNECPDIVLVSEADLDLDILDLDLSDDEDEEERPGSAEQSSDDSSEDDSSDDSSSEDESSDDESLEERVRCTFCGLVMTRRVFHHQTSASRADRVTSPAIARVPRCKLCRSPTPPSPLVRPDDSKQGDYVEEMPLAPRFRKDAESGNLRKFVMLKCRDLRLQDE